MDYIIGNGFKIKVLMFLSMLNLLFMHYYFYVNGCIEWTWLYSEIINLCSVFFDLFGLLIISLIVVRGNIKLSVLITYTITFLWSFVNVIYGRFFFQYMSLSAVKEVFSLGDSLVVNSVLYSFHWYDLYFLLSVFSFVYLYRRTITVQLHLKSIKKILFVPFVSLLLTFFFYSVYHFAHPHYRNNWDLYIFRAKEFLYDPVRGGTPNLVHYQTGILRVSLFEFVDLFHSPELTQEQRKEVAAFYNNDINRTTHHICNPNIKNVFFILLESFLSSPIDLYVDGVEVTPFLNSLKKESDVYYNGMVKSDIGCGESGDGQFIYMSGILPLKYRMTVGQVKKHILPGLPNVLRDKMDIKKSEIIFPTAPNLWQQADMNTVYGFTKAYSLEDIVDNNSNEIDDKKIFQFASDVIPPGKDPFFMLILSISTHSPYNKYVGDYVIKNNKDYPTEYINYLNTCHYTDSQLRSFFDALKNMEIYDNSMIVVAADHYAHLDMLKMDGKISNHTPLFIVHGNIDREQAWSGECHQLDVYTTIIDVLGIDNEWKGLGNTLLSPQYVNSVTDKAHSISELIIEGDYFKRNK